MRNREGSRGTRRRSLAATGGGAALLLAACGVGGGNASGDQAVPKLSAQPVTLRLAARAGGDEALWKFLQPVLKQKLPNVTIEFEGFPGDFSQYLEKVTVLAASGQLGDIIYQTTSSGLFDLLLAGKLLRPVDDLVRADRYDLKVFYRPGTDLLTRDGKLYGLPNTCQPGSVILYYNKKLLEAVGAPLPTPEWTPEEALNAARRATRPGEVWGYVLDMSSAGLLAMIQAFGGRWLSKDGKKAELNMPGTRQALTYMADLMHRHRVAPAPGMMPGNTMTNVQGGRVAMFISSTSTATQIQAQTDVEIGTSLIPRVRRDLPRGIMRVDGYSVTAASKYPREAWEAIKMVTGPEGSLLRADVPGASGTLGCTPSAWSDPGVMRSRGTMQQMFVRVLGESEVNIMAGNYRNDEYQQVMTQKLDPVWKGESQITDGLMQDLQQSVQAVLDKPRIS